MTENTFSFENLHSDSVAGDTNTLMIVLYIHHRKNSSPLDDIALFNQLFLTIKSKLKEEGELLKESSSFKGWFAASIAELNNFFLQKVDLDADQNIMVIRVGASCDMSANKAWPILHTYLSDLIKPWIDSFPDDSPSLDLLGTSLIYKGYTEQTEIVEKTPSSDVLQTIKSWHNYNAQFVLAKAIYQQSPVFLLQTSDSNTNLSTLTYLMVARKNADFNQAFYQTNIFFTVDKNLHSCSYHWNQLQQPEFKSFDNKLTLLSDSIVSVLNHMKSADTKRSEQTLTDMADYISDLLAPYSLYSRLALSMKVQVENIIDLVKNHNTRTKNENDIYNYYLNRVTFQYKDCKVKLHRYHIIMKQADTAIALVEAQQSKISTHNTNSIQMQLAILGACLAFIQVLDDKAATGILNYLIGDRPKGPSWHHLLMIKLSLTIGLGLIFYSVYRLFLQKTVKA